MAKYFSYSFTICFILFFSYSQVTSQESSHHVSDFLNKLMRDYVPKNTRHYTLVNGEPVYSGSDPAKASDLSRNLLSPNGNPFLNALVPDAPSPFLNYGPWSPTPSATPSRSPSFFSSLFGRNVDSPDETMKAEEKSQIITVDDLPTASPDVREFKIESSMTF